MLWRITEIKPIFVKPILDVLAKERRKSSDCLNCQEELSPEMNYCPHCGQENHDRRVTVKLLIQDVLRDNLSLDNKAIRSLIPLMIKPGFLTAEFLKGRRVSYNRPLRLYLFISFLFFVLSSFIRYNTESGKEVVIDSTNEVVLDFGSMSVISTQDSTNNVEEEKSYLKKRVDYVNSPEGRREFQDMMGKNLPIFVFLLIPVLGFWVYLFFWKKGRFYVDGFVFALHLQTFFFILAVIIQIVQLFVPNSIVQLLMILIVVIYFFVAARRVFKTSVLGSVLRLLGVAVVHSITVIILLTVFMLGNILLLPAG